VGGKIKEEVVEVQLIRRIMRDRHRIKGHVTAADQLSGGDLRWMPASGWMSGHGCSATTKDAAQMWESIAAAPQN
jgi:hypothetical protein